MKKIALFADVQNLYYTVRQAHGCHFHYAELWRQVAALGEIVEARAYAIDRGDAKQRQFQQILRDLGFEVIAGLVNDYCQVAGYPFHYENFGVDQISSYQGKSGQNAKAFIAEIGWDTVLTIGSGNATLSAGARNQVKALAEYRKAVGK